MVTGRAARLSHVCAWLANLAQEAPDACEIEIRRVLNFTIVYTTGSWRI